jgi:hypothetical protein
VTEIELAPLVAKLRQMVAHARTHGCFDGGVRDEITEAADKLEALSGRVSTLTLLVEESLYHLRLDERAKNYHERALAALAQTQSEG